MYTSGSLIHSCAPPTSSNSGVLSSSRSYDWTKSIEKQFSIFESSGSIVHIVCRAGHQNERVMIGACATTGDERYNRIGELILAYRDPKFTGSTNFDVLVLDGHKKQKSTPNGLVTVRHTVSCVVYDPLTDVFVSGGYDGDVVAWDASNANSLNTIGSHPKPIISMACHSSTPLIAYGCQNGGLFYFNSMTDLGERGSKARPVNIFTKPRAKDAFSNIVDSVAIPSAGLRANSCYAGIGYLQPSGAGVIEGWDLQTGKFTCTSEKLYDGFACMNISSCGKYK